MLARARFAPDRYCRDHPTIDALQHDFDTRERLGAGPLIAEIALNLIAWVFQTVPKLAECFRFDLTNALVSQP